MNIQAIKDNIKILEDMPTNELQALEEVIKQTLDKRLNRKTLSSNLDSRIYPRAIIRGIVYNFYDFQTKDGKKIFGWFPPKDMLNKPKPIRTEEEVLKLINQN